MRTAVIVFAFLIGSAAAARPTPPQSKDETVILDAVEKRVVLAQYHDAKAVLLEGARAGGWRLYAGAVIDARHIDLTLRNVRGQVRFRADWTRVDALLRRHRDVPPPSPR